MSQYPNSITVTIPFSFKGNEHQPSIVVDLDQYAQHHADFSFLFHQVASENNISNFSYEYEVLESSPLFFSEPTGLAQAFLNDNHFDLAGFKQKLTETKVLGSLQQIARETLGMDDLAQDPTLKQALLEAYLAGQQNITQDAIESD